MGGYQGVEAESDLFQLLQYEIPSLIEPKEKLGIGKVLKSVHCQISHDSSPFSDASVSGGIGGPSGGTSGGLTTTSGSMNSALRRRKSDDLLIKVFVKQMLNASNESYLARQLSDIIKFKNRYCEIRAKWSLSHQPSLVALTPLEHQSALQANQSYDTGGTASGGTPRLTATDSGPSLVAFSGSRRSSSKLSSAPLTGAAEKRTSLTTATSIGLSLSAAGLDTGLSSPALASGASGTPRSGSSSALTSGAGTSSSAALSAGSGITGSFDSTRLPWNETRAFYLGRQFFAQNLFDRIHSPPYLESIEKLWIIYQLLRAVLQAHNTDVVHGDIKAENCMLTTWNWLFLTDFHPYKPAQLPYNNPHEYHVFFDDGKRARCYVAPERFFMSQSDRRTSTLNPMSDIFSVGCVIAEVFMNGTPPFDYTQLLQYKDGKYDPFTLINKKIQAKKPSLSSGRRGVCVSERTKEILRDYPKYFASDSSSASTVINDGFELDSEKKQQQSRSSVYHADDELREYDREVRRLSMVRDLIKRCLQLDPTRRASAEKLLLTYRSTGLFPRYFDELFSLGKSLLRKDFRDSDYKMKYLRNKYWQLLEAISGQRFEMEEIPWRTAKKADDESEQKHDPSVGSGSSSVSSKRGLKRTSSGKSTAKRKSQSSSSLSRKSDKSKGSPSSTSSSSSSSKSKKSDSSGAKRKSGEVPSVPLIGSLPEESTTDDHSTSSLKGSKLTTSSVSPSKGSSVSPTSKAGIDGDNEKDEDDFADALDAPPKGQRRGLHKPRDSVMEALISPRPSQDGAEIGSLIKKLEIVENDNSPDFKSAIAASLITRPSHSRMLSGAVSSKKGDRGGVMSSGVVGESGSEVVSSGSGVTSPVSGRPGHAKKATHTAMFIRMKDWNPSRGEPLLETVLDGGSAETSGSSAADVGSRRSTAVPPTGVRESVVVHTGRSTRDLTQRLAKSSVDSTSTEVSVVHAPIGSASSRRSGLSMAFDEALLNTRESIDSEPGQKGSLKTGTVSEEGANEEDERRIEGAGEKDLEEEDEETVLSEEPEDQVEGASPEGHSEKETKKKKSRDDDDDDDGEQGERDDDDDALPSKRPRMDGRSSDTSGTSGYRRSSHTAGLFGQIQAAYKGNMSRIIDKKSVDDMMSRLNRMKISQKKRQKMMQDRMKKLDEKSPSEIMDDAAKGRGVVTAAAYSLKKTLSKDIDYYHTPQASPAMGGTSERMLIEQSDDRPEFIDAKMAAHDVSRIILNDDKIVTSDAEKEGNSDSDEEELLLEEDMDPSAAISAMSKLRMARGFHRSSDDTSLYLDTPKLHPVSFASGKGGRRKRMHFRQQSTMVDPKLSEYIMADEPVPLPTGVLNRKPVYEGFVILNHMICSTIRNCRRSTAKLTGLEMIGHLAEYLSDYIRLDRSVPYLKSLIHDDDDNNQFGYSLIRRRKKGINDEEPIVIARVIEIMSDITSSVNEIGLTYCVGYFTHYILDTLQLLLSEHRRKDHSELIQIAIASKIGQIAATAKYFLDYKHMLQMTIASHSSGLVTNILPSSSLLSPIGSSQSSSTAADLFLASSTASIRSGELKRKSLATSDLASIAKAATSSSSSAGSLFPATPGISGSLTSAAASTSALMSGASQSTSSRVDSVLTIIENSKRELKRLKNKIWCLFELLWDDENQRYKSVKRGLLKNCIPLISFFGAKNSDIIPRLFTLFNQNDWQLLVDFLDLTIAMRIFVGKSVFQTQIQPCLQTLLNDARPPVLCRCLECLTVLCEMKQYTWYELQSLVMDVAPIMMHYSPYVRNACLNFILSVARLIGDVRAHHDLLSRIESLLNRDCPLVFIDRDSLTLAMKKPLSHKTYNFLLDHCTDMDRDSLFEDCCPELVNDQPLYDAILPYIKGVKRSTRVSLPLHLQSVVTTSPGLVYHSSSSRDAHSIGAGGRSLTMTGTSTTTTTTRGVSSSLSGRSHTSRTLSTKAPTIPSVAAMELAGSSEIDYKRHFGHSATGTPLRPLELMLAYVEPVKPLFVPSLGGGSAATGTSPVMVTSDPSRPFGDPALIDTISADIAPDGTTTMISTVPSLTTFGSAAEIGDSSSDDRSGGGGSSSGVSGSGDAFQELLSVVSVVSGHGMVTNVPLKRERLNGSERKKYLQCLNLPHNRMHGGDKLLTDRISTCSFYKNHTIPMPSSIGGSDSIQWQPRGRVITQLSEHNDSVNVMRVTRDNLFVATASSDKTVKIWLCDKIHNSANVKSELTYSLHRCGEAVSMAILDTSHRIAVGTREGIIHVFNVNHSHSSGMIGGSGVTDASGLGGSGLDYLNDMVGGLDDSGSGIGHSSSGISGGSSGGGGGGSSSMIEFQAAHKMTLDPEESAILCLEHFDTLCESMLVFGTQFGNIHGWDIRKKSSAWSLHMEASMGTISAMCVGPTPNCLVVGTSRGFVCVWDLRFEIVVQMWQHFDKTAIVSLTILNQRSCITHGRTKQMRDVLSSAIKGVSNSLDDDYHSHSSIAQSGSSEVPYYSDSSKKPGPLIFVATENGQELCGFDLFSGKCRIRFKMNSDKSFEQRYAADSTSPSPGPMSSSVMDGRPTLSSASKRWKGRLMDKVSIHHGSGSGSGSSKSGDGSSSRMRKSKKKAHATSTASAIGLKFSHLNMAYPREIGSSPAWSVFSRPSTIRSTIIGHGSGMFGATSTDSFVSGYNHGIEYNYACGYTPSILSSDVNAHLISNELEDMCSDFGKERGGVTGVLVSQNEFLVTAGRDRIVRYWNLQNPQKSFRISSTETTLSHRYTAHYDSNYNEIVFQEYVVAPSDLDASSSSHHSRGASYVSSGSDHSRSEYHYSQDGGRSYSSMKMTAKMKSQHQDSITDLKAVEYPRNMLLTSSRNGIVKVWI